MKLLEGGPCFDCVSVSNVHMTTEGNVSVDVSITHPYDNPVYTGFDVRGIIMFPASQVVPDDDIRALAGLPPHEGQKSFISLPWAVRALAKIASSRAAFMLVPSRCTV